MQGYVRPAQYAHAARQSVDAVRRAVISGKIPGTQDASGAWWIPAAEYERVVQSKCGEQDARAAAEAIPATYAAFRPTVLQLHRLGCQREVCFLSLEADAREAETAGDLARAEMARKIVTTLRASTYRWDAELERWAVTTPDGVTGYSAAERREAVS